MSYLPQLRESLVKAARREAEAPSPETPARGKPAAGKPAAGMFARWRPRLGGIAAFIAAAAAIAVMVVALVSLGHRHAPAPSAPAPAEPQLTFAQHEAASRAAAQRLLDSVALPPGAVRAASDPSSPAQLGTNQNALAIPNRVAVHRFWRVPGTVLRVADWFGSHQPRDASIARGSEAQAASAKSARGTRRRTTLEMWAATYTSATAPTGVTSQQLSIALAPAKGGGVAIRADGEAGFVLPRPVAQQLPAGTDRVHVVVRFTHPTSAPAADRALIRPRTYDLTSPQRIEQLVTFMNVMPAAPQSAAACLKNPHPAARSVGLAVDLTFYAAGRSQPLAVADLEPSCNGVGLTVANRPRQNLLLNFRGFEGLQYAALLEGLATKFTLLPRPAAGTSSARHAKKVSRAGTP
jgi:hypothetical protein